MDGTEFESSRGIGGGFVENYVAAGEESGEVEVLEGNRRGGGGGGVGGYG